MSLPSLLTRNAHNIPPCSPTLQLCSLAPGPRALLCAPERLLIGQHYRHICSLIGQSSAGPTLKNFMAQFFTN